MKTCIGTLTVGKKENLKVCHEVRADQNPVFSFRVKGSSLECQSPLYISGKIEEYISEDEDVHFIPALQRRNAFDLDMQENSEQSTQLSQPAQPLPDLPPRPSSGLDLRGSSNDN